MSSSAEHFVLTPPELLPIAPLREGLRDPRLQTAGLDAVGHNQHFCFIPLEERKKEVERSVGSNDSDSVVVRKLLERTVTLTPAEGDAFAAMPGDDDPLQDDVGPPEALAVPAQVTIDTSPHHDPSIGQILSNVLRGLIYEEIFCPGDRSRKTSRDESP
jgi:hypothetical protein